MQCTKCGAELAPFVTGCAVCAALPPIPPDVSGKARPTAYAAKKDIPWLSFTLICLPFLIIAGVRNYAMYPGDSAKVQGAIAGVAALAAGIAWLISRFSHTRFRLTWAICYAVAVIIPVAESLSTPGAKVAGTTAPTDAKSSLAAMKIRWPAGWTVSPSKSLPSAHAASVDGASESAMLVEDGQAVAIISLVLTHNGVRRSLADSVMDMIDGAKETAADKGVPVAFTDPMAATRTGRSALQFDATYTSPDATRRQRNVATQGTDYLLCTMSYTAIEANFEKHLGEFETTLNQLDCP